MATEQRTRYRLFYCKRSYSVIETFTYENSKSFQNVCHFSTIKIDAQTFKI